MKEQTTYYILYRQNFEFQINFSQNLTFRIDLDKIHLSSLEWNHFSYSFHNSQWISMLFVLNERKIKVLRIFWAEFWNSKYFSQNLTYKIDLKKFTFLIFNGTFSSTTLTVLNYFWMNNDAVCFKWKKKTTYYMFCRQNFEFQIYFSQNLTFRIDLDKIHLANVEGNHFSYSFQSSPWISMLFVLSERAIKILHVFWAEYWNSKKFSQNLTYRIDLEKNSPS